MNDRTESWENPKEAAKSKVSGSRPSRGRFPPATLALPGPPVGLVSLQDDQVTDGDFPGKLGAGMERTSGEMMGGREVRGQPLPLVGLEACPRIRCGQRDTAGAGRLRVTLLPPRGAEALVLKGLVTRVRFSPHSPRPSPPTPRPGR